MMNDISIEYLTKILGEKRYESMMNHEWLTAASTILPNRIYKHGYTQSKLHTVECYLYNNTQFISQLRYSDNILIDDVRPELLFKFEFSSTEDIVSNVQQYNRKESPNSDEQFYGIQTGWYHTKSWKPYQYN